MRRFLLAGAGGIEPTSEVLETSVLPLNDAPMVFSAWPEYLPTRQKSSGGNSKPAFWRGQTFDSRKVIEKTKRP